MASILQYRCRAKPFASLATTCSTTAGMVSAVALKVELFQHERPEFCDSAGGVPRAVGGRRATVIADLLARLRRRETLLGQIVRFGAMTAMSATVSLGLPVVLHEALGIAPRLAVGIAFVVAFCLSFVTTRRLVFASSGSVRRDLSIFVASTAAFRLAEYMVFLALMAVAGLHYVVALVAALAVSSIAKFFWYRYTFRSTTDGKVLPSL
jgi:putative flippase GtrA